MIIYIYNSEGYQGLNYLDDLASTKIKQLAEQAFTILGDILKSAGAKESLDKALIPSTRMVFLGTRANARNTAGITKVETF